MTMQKLFAPGDRVRRSYYGSVWEADFVKYNRVGYACVENISNTDINSRQDFEGGWDPKNFELVAPAGPEIYEEWFK